MTETTRAPAVDDIEYPDSDGLPMAENTLQFEWITTVKLNLDALFADRPDVFVAGDLLWYPVRGDNQTRVAPDAMVAFGRPKGHRGSYRQWEEGGVAPQVVFEILSPGNTVAEMGRKRRFYDRYGVEEYYVYDPDNPWLEGWRREGTRLVTIPEMHGWTSPRLGVRFELPDDGLRLYRPDGKRFLTYLELEREARQAEKRADTAERRADTAERRADALAARLRELGIDPGTA
mgnify:CR=1 FL=1